MTQIEILLDVALFLAGMVLLANWLIKTRLGKLSLADIAPKDTNIAPHTAMIVFFSWMLLNSAIAWLFKDKFATESLFVYSSRTIVSIIFIVITLVIANKTFTGKLKGFGIDFKTAPKDLAFAVINLLSVWPAIIAGIAIVIIGGKMIFGQDFQFNPHQSLETLKAGSGIIQKIVMITMIIIITPALEELIFRGLIQSTIRSYVPNSWLAIALAAGMFTVLHQPMHWLAIFALSLCLGYSYEKSGSILRPIFIHIIFNAVNTISALSM